MRTHLFFSILTAAILFCGCASVDRQSIETAQSEEMLVPATFSAPSSGNFVMKSHGGDSMLPVQVCELDRTASALIPSSLIENQDFILRKSRRSVERFPAFRWEDDGKNTLSLYEGERLVLKYRYGVIQPPEGAPADRARSSYIHPLMGLDGETLTEDFPKDHYHHRGLFYAWTGIYLDGKKVDMWEIQDLWYRFEEITELKVGPVYASMTVRNAWHTKDRKIMTEIMELKVWHSDRYGQALDERYTWIPLEPIQLGPKDYKGYGGLNIRFPERKDTVVTNIDGVIAKDSELKRSPWSDFSARFEGRSNMSGLTVINHPFNIDPNPPWLYRVTDTYGFLGVSWPGALKFDFVPGHSYKNTYRIWLHRGDLKQSNAQEIIEAYLQPPKIKIVD